MKEGKLKELLFPIAQEAHAEDCCSSAEADKKANEDIDIILNEVKKEFKDAIFESGFWEDRVKKCMELYVKWFGENK